MGSVSFAKLNRVPSPERRLTLDESTTSWLQLVERWGVDGSAYWLPFSDATPRGRVDCYWVDDVGAYVGMLREIARQLGHSRIIELHEGGPQDPAILKHTTWDAEVDLVEWEPRYVGLERYSTPPTFDWLVYASHEGTLAVAGDALAEQVAVEPRGLSPLESLDERIPHPRD
jgi:hypothetical protein